MAMCNFNVISSRQYNLARKIIDLYDSLLCTFLSNRAFNSF